MHESGARVGGLWAVGVLPLFVYACNSVIYNYQKSSFFIENTIGANGTGEISWF